MDDVGWGDFGVYGGGVAVGAPTPNMDRLAREGLLLTSCYSEPSCTPSRATLLTGRLPMRHGLQRPPMYGEPGGLEGEVTVAQLLADAGYVTQAVGKWHLGENVASQPQHVGFDDFYGFLSVSDMYTEWRDPYFFPEVVYSEARTEWIKNIPFNKCFVHATRGGEVEEVEEVTIPVLSELDDKWAAYSEEFIERMAGADEPWFLYHCTRGAHFDNYPHERFLGSSPGPAPVQGHDGRARRHRRPARRGAASDRTARATRSIFISSDNGPEMETWPDAAFTPFRCAKGSTWEGGVRVPGVLSWPGMIEAGRVSDGLFSFTDLLPTVLTSPAPTTGPDRPLHRRRRPDVVPAGPRRAVEPEVPVLLARPDVHRAPRRRVQVHARRDLRRRHRRPRRRRVHRRRAEVSRTGGSTTCTSTPRRRTPT